MPKKRKSPYDAQWRQLRLEVLRQANYRCYVAGCTERATQGDHIVPLSEGGARLDRANVRPSCAAHNSGRVLQRLAAMARLNRSNGVVREW